MGGAEGYCGGYVFLLGEASFGVTRRFMRAVGVIGKGARTLTCRRREVREAVYGFFPSLYGTSVPSLRGLVGPARDVSFCGTEIICNRRNIRTMRCTPCFVQGVGSLRIITSSAVACNCGDASHDHLGTLITRGKGHSSVVVIGRKLLASASFAGLTVFSNGR